MSTPSLRHALHVSFAVLLAVGVLRAWQDAPTLPLGGVRAGIASALALALLAAYVAGALIERRLGPARRTAWVIGLVVLWGAGVVATEGFSWVAFPLYFLVLYALPGRRAIVTVASLVGWSVLAAVARLRLDGTPQTPAVGVWLGPLLGALCAVGAMAVFGRLRADAERQRALVIELRETRDELASAARRAGVLTERERLAREIHDTVAQGLGSIVMIARTAQTADDGRAALSRVEAIARENLTEARRFVRDLSGPRTTLDESLRALARDVSAGTRLTGTPLHIEVRTDGEPVALPAAAQTALDRGVQASLANVVQHASAARCVVSLTWWPDRVGVDVADDGRGFDPSASPARADSFGLAGLRARLAEVGGSVTVDSRPGDGTTVSLVVPLGAEA